MPALYDTIGIDYAQLRKPDPRIAVQIERALGAARTVLNVGAGTGSYEPADRDVVALEPSAEMISQRPPGAAPAVQGSAGAIPFPDQSFDAAIGVLTIHHWADQQQGIREMCRVARERVVLLTFDPAARPWLTDYLPELATLDEAAMPSLDTLSDWLGSVAIEPVLDPRIRKGSSSFWKIEQAEAGLARLAEDLANGVWEQRYAALLAGDSYDAGYRLVISLR
ncbi:MAG: class I SAM-dependent methyltransferase [Novosphingobium sp.]|nr:class I SAM-dependent methyltransferase [Novosphingobium sp.]